MHADLAVLQVSSHTKFSRSGWSHTPGWTTAVTGLWWTENRMGSLVRLGSDRIARYSELPGGPLEWQKMLVLAGRGEPFKRNAVSKSSF